ncbi:MAG: precorrin-6y C5,15-methyltransferase (decarboxylating) subunit CbiE [Treponema sp.]|jgi:precorrin-6Y C5,15-methyltransferase (decarboxylating)|nr:precorrin-6y C5,15-methyltransferase (decarboxylating) subunit CbiE [Treponema sp.]
MKNKPKIYLIGTGTGSRDLLTDEARKAILECRCIIGSERLLANIGDLITGKPRMALIRTEDIFHFITTGGDPVLGVLFSGDAGFYSGAGPLIPLLRQERYSFTVISGVSSLSYFAGRLGRPWENVRTVSLHGRRLSITGHVLYNRETFFLTDNEMNPAAICTILDRDGLGGLAVSVGERLSYDDERITSGSARELANKTFDPLSVLLVENPNPLSLSAGNYGISDDLFIRAGVPMTKEAVRAVSVSKLMVENNSTVWDIGAGTGSVSCEIALRVRYGRVYAVEKDPEALALLEKNKQQFGLHNIEIVSGAAPGALQALPKPDQVFIGGAGREFEAIIRIILEKNPRVRLVITAVTLETLGRMTALLRDRQFYGVEIVQVSAARAEQTGSCHLMKGYNPVYIFSGSAGEQETPDAGGKRNEAAAGRGRLDAR